MPSSPVQPIQAILVPQGAEYQAVCRGLQRVEGIKETLKLPSVLAIPVGVRPLRQYLDKMKPQFQLEATLAAPAPIFPILMMGLCGSLSPVYGVGAVTIYESCTYLANLDNSSLTTRNCDRNLALWLSNCLPDSAKYVKALTSDRLIHLASEKQKLAEIFKTDVVDMEGYAALEGLSDTRTALAMVRVVSDDSQTNLPDLAAAIDANGKIQPFPLAIAMLKQPAAAARLIRGSLQALKVLEQTTTSLFAGLRS